MGDIGKVVREVEFEPMPEPQVPEPQEAPAAPEPVKAPVPA